MHFEFLYSLVIVKNQLVNKATVWSNDKAFISVNVVALHQARLVLGWVTICGHVYRLDM